MEKIEEAIDNMLDLGRRYCDDAIEHWKNDNWTHRRLHHHKKKNRNVKWSIGNSEIIEEQEEQSDEQDRD
jgi:hypothetical protein